MAPQLVAISTVVRSYSLAFVFMAASLWALEVAFETESWRWMALSAPLLYGAIVSDYSIACYAGAAGAYGLLRIRSASRAVRTAWLAGQFGAIAVYGALYRVQVAKLKVEYSYLTEGYLANEFPRPATYWTFPFVQTAPQFEFVTSSIALGLILMAAFVAGLAALWRSGEPRRRSLIVLLTLPFLIAIACAYLSVLPYGGSRQTVILGVFGILGAGFGDPRAGMGDNALGRNLGNPAPAKFARRIQASRCRPQSYDSAGLHNLHGRRDDAAVGLLPGPAPSIGLPARRLYPGRCGRPPLDDRRIEIFL
jgi:hypothetical protein